MQWPAVTLRENASQAFLAATSGSMRQFWVELGTVTVDPDLLTAAEKLQYNAYLRRDDVNAAIHVLATVGVAIKEIVLRMGRSRETVRRIPRGQRSEIFMPRESSLERHLPWLDARWAAGGRNAFALWRDLKALGFRGSSRVVANWATRQRRCR